MVHLARCKKEVTAMEYAQIFVDNVVWLNGLHHAQVVGNPMVSGKYFKKHAGDYDQPLEISHWEALWYGGTSGSPAGSYTVGPNERLTKIKLQ